MLLKIRVQVGRNFPEVQTELVYCIYIFQSVTWCHGSLLLHFPWLTVWSWLMCCLQCMNVTQTLLVQVSFNINYNKNRLETENIFLQEESIVTETKNDRENWIILKVVWYKKPFFPQICSRGKLWSYVNMLTQAMRKNMLIGTVVAMATYWCILLLGLSALLISTDISIVTEGRWKESRQNYFNTLAVCNEPQCWSSFCFLSEKKFFEYLFSKIRPFLRQIFS